LTGKLLVILGPTAVGKTKLAIHLAQALDGEIIGADSRQIYRFMDIGTAKPSAQQRQQVPHHLIDIVDPDETLGLAQIQSMTYAAIDAIHQRDRLPLLVGGTGQYISAVIEGWSIPEVPPNMELRNMLEQVAAEFGPEALHQRLAEVDPVAAETIHQHNIRRVIRALEVYSETGTAISELQKKHPPPYNIQQYGLTLSREPLYRRADQRLEQMMKAGFLAEVQMLLDKGYDRRLPAISGLGYAQLASHLLDGLSLDDALAETRRMNRDFIRRQFTWFRGHDSGIQWLETDQFDPDALIDTSRQWLEQD
jgi:tRNA dimethylallyltransferase